MVPVILIIGVPGSGKSWCARQLKDKYTYVPHDRCWTHPEKFPPKDGDGDCDWPSGAKSTHVMELVRVAAKSDKPIITECPFAERELREQLEAHGIKVEPIFIIEPPRIVMDRYQKRSQKRIPKSFLTRATSIVDRADEWQAERGTSQEVLEILRSKV